ncbi:MAG: AAA family ATPase [Acidimicrobiia bacterium]
MQSIETLDARGRWRARLADRDLPELCGPSGLWAACREAARAGDDAFLDTLDVAAIGTLFDDELPAFPGVRPSVRLRGLVAAARLATDRVRARVADQALRDRWVAHATDALAALRAPGAAAWTAPVLPSDAGAAHDGPDTVDAVLLRLQQLAPDAAFAVLWDLLADVTAAAPSGPSASVHVPLARAAGRGLGVLVVREVETVPAATPAGIAFDAARAPFLRWDAAFQRATEAAWWASGRPDRALRWSLVWEADGRPVEVVEGPSIGLGLAVAIGVLLHPHAWTDLSATAVTGRLDEAGEVGSLLPAEDTVTEAYRDKLLAVAAAGRRLVLPEQDRAAVAAAADRAEVRLELVGVEHLDELRAEQPTVLGEEPVCPYKGLEPFGRDDAAWFHGRERQLAELAGLLATNRLVGVLGASGAGKSSMTRAGLLPALADGVVAGSQRWPQVVCTPGDDPWASLLDALGDAGSARGVADGSPDPAERGPELLDALRRRGPQAPPLLLVIDQFEELFTLAPEQAPSLLAALAEAARTVPNVRIVPVIRADFYGEVSADATFARLLSEHHVLVGPMTPQELRRVVTAPADAAGLVLERALVRAVLDDVASQPTALPHLSTALRETWARRQGRTLTLAGYQEAGGVQNAIARLADRLYTEAAEADQPRLRRLISQLVDLGEERPVRRRVEPADLAADPEDRRVLEALTAARLVTVSDGGVELTHDAVLSFWPRLGTWLEESRQQLLAQRRLDHAAREWAAEGRNHDGLLRGDRLAALAGGLPADEPAPGTLAREYLDASVAAEQAGREAVEHTNRRLRRRLAATSVALVLALVGAGAFAWQRQRATEHEQAATVAEAARAQVEQAVLAQSTLQSDSRARTALLSLAALANGPNFEAVVGLGSALSTFDRPIETYTVHSDDVETAVVGADGTLIASGSWDGSVRLSDARTAATRLTLTDGATTARSVALSPSADHLAAVFYCDDPAEAPCERRVLAWDAQSGTPVLDVDTGTVNVAVAFVGDEQLAVIDAGAVTVYRLDGSVVRTVGAAELGLGELTSLAAHRNGLVAVGDGDGQVRWFPAAPQEAPDAPRTGETGAAVTALAFSSGGAVLAVGDAEGAISLLDATTGEVRGPDPAPFKPEEVPPPALESGQAVRTLAFAPDDGRLAAGGGSFDKRVGGDNDVRVWSLPDQRALRRLVGGTSPVRAVGFRDDGRVVAVGAERRMRVFESAAGEQLWQRTLQPRCAPTGWLNPSGACWLTSVVLVDGGRMVVTGWDKTVALLDADGNELARVTDPGADGETPYWSWSKRLAVDAGGTRLAVPTDRGAVALWRLDGERLTVEAELPAELGEDGEPVLINAVRFDPAGERLAAARADGSVQVWQLDGARSLWVGRHGDPVWSLDNYVNQVTWSPDGTRLVSGGGDARLRVWDAADGTELAVSDELPFVLNVAAWSPDGRTIISGGADGEVRLWDADDGGLHLRRKFYFDTTAIVTASFNESSTLAVLTDQAKLVRVVDLGSGRQIAAFPLDTQPTDAVFTADEQRIIVTDKDGELTAFSGPATWPDAACRLAGRNLTTDEWELYVGPDRAYVTLCPDLPSSGGSAATDLAPNLVASLEARADGA